MITTICATFSQAQARITLGLSQTTDHERSDLPQRVHKHGLVVAVAGVVMAPGQLLGQPQPQCLQQGQRLWATFHRDTLGDSLHTSAWSITQSKFVTTPIEVRDSDSVPHSTGTPWGTVYIIMVNVIFVTTSSEIRDSDSVPHSAGTPWGTVYTNMFHVSS